MFGLFQKKRVDRSFVPSLEGGVALLEPRKLLDHTESWSDASGSGTVTYDDSNQMTSWETNYANGDYKSGDGYGDYYERTALGDETWYDVAGMHGYTAHPLGGSEDFWKTGGTITEQWKHNADGSSEYWWYGEDRTVNGQQIHVTSSYTSNALGATTTIASLDQTYGGFNYGRTLTSDENAGTFSFIYHDAEGTLKTVSGNMADYTIDYSSVMIWDSNNDIPSGAMTETYGGPHYNY